MPAYIGLTTKIVALKGHDGVTVDAYLGTPDTQGPVPGVVVIHHMPGWDEWSMEVVRRLAHHGFAAICPNLHQRGGEGTLEEIGQRVRDAGGVNDAQYMGDLQAAVDELLASPISNGKVGLIGFCSGGRICYIAAAKLENVDAAVDCWGGGVTNPPGKLTDLRPVAPIDMTPDIKCPLLGIFGNDDENPDPAQVDAIEAELKKHGKTYEFHRYDGAGHGFFAWERPNYRQEQAVEAWKRVFAFYEKHLGAPATVEAAVAHA
ncbi:MAG: dienelactone hydrolase family protein [Chloroflexi bacterium]|nr:dienelactone hydrolase family protein [Chloroflexota bacterium]